MIRNHRFWPFFLVVLFFILLFFLRKGERSLDSQIYLDFEGKILGKGPNRNIPNDIYRDSGRLGNYEPEEIDLVYQMNKQEIKLYLNEETMRLNQNDIELNCHR